jgi:tetratricopeptide (TPR) repeat protein
MISNPREIFFQALNLFKEGKAEDAEPLCKQLLKLNPKEVNTLRLYGQIQHSKGDLIEAEKAFASVISLAGDYAHAFMDLGAVKKSQGDLLRAEKYLREALRLNGNLHAATRMLQEILLKQDKQQEAGEFNAQLKQRDKIAALITQANEQLKEKNYTELERLGREILVLDPANIAILLILADYASSELNAPRAEKLFTRIIEAAPENWRAWNGLSRSLLLQDKTDAALKNLQRSLEIEPKANETRTLEAETHIKNYNYEKGIDLLERLLEKSPKLNNSRIQLAQALKTIGQQEQAVKEFKQCIETDETFGEAYWGLSDMKTYVFSQEDILQMETILSQRDLKEKSQVHFGYALGKAYEHQKEYRKAFNFYQNANTTQKTLIDYSAEKNSNLTDRIINNFSSETFERLSNTEKNDTATPIFVVSLPRSGSTLQEQILASHSQVEGTQELPYMPRITARMGRTGKQNSSPLFPEIINDLTTEDIKRFTNQYLKQAEFHRQDKTPYFIDKLPNNFSNIGLILLCFPNAKIINARRHPMDSCLGCFKQLWAMGQHFTYDLEDLGRYYRDYERLMEHWHKVLPGRILDVQYEDVVDDLPTHVNRLLDYCELPFEEACVNFHQTERAVKTSSSEQVRKPIYRSALAYWKNFDELLDPLKQALETP